VSKRQRRVQADAPTDDGPRANICSAILKPKKAAKLVTPQETSALDGSEAEEPMEGMFEF